MDDEKLIKLVRNHPVLYDTSNPKYMDARYKTDIWMQIGGEMGHPAGNCKSRWQNIRDQLRKSWAKKTPKTRKYKYEDLLYFLIPYFVDRGDSSSAADPSTDPLDYEILFDDASNDETELEGFGILENRKRKLAQGSSSPSLSKYTVSMDPDPHPIDAFLTGLSATIKSFSPYYQHLVKGKLFAVVQEMELQQLKETNGEKLGVSSPTAPTSP